MAESLIIIKQSAPGGGTGAVDSVNGMTGVVVLNKSHVGLGDVNNTSDVDKPVSTAQSTAISTAASVAASVDVVLSTALSAEVSTRTLEGATLSTALSTETVARTSADSSLTTRVSTEESVRASLTVSTDLRMYAWETSFSALESRVSDLEFEVPAISTAVSAETSSRVSADTSLEAALGAEASARASVDTSLSIALAGGGGAGGLGISSLHSSGLRTIRDFRPGRSAFWIMGEPLWYRVVSSSTLMYGGFLSNFTITSSGVTGVAATRSFYNDPNYPYGEFLYHNAPGGVGSAHSINLSDLSFIAGSADKQLTRIIFFIDRSLGNSTTDVSFIRIGMHNATASTEPSNYWAVVYSSSTGQIVLRCRGIGASTELVLATAVLDQIYDVVVERNQYAGYIRVWVNGVLIGDITTNLPSITNSLGVQHYISVFGSAANTPRVRIRHFFALFNTIEQP